MRNGVRNTICWFNIPMHYYAPRGWQVHLAVNVILNEFSDWYRVTSLVEEIILALATCMYL